MPSKPWSEGYRRFPPAVIDRVRREEPACRSCGAPTAEVDHVVGRADALRMGWPEELIQDRRNAQGLCSECHRAKTSVERTRGIEQGSKYRPKEQHPGLKPI